MAKLNHQKRSRPRPAPTRRRRSTIQRVADQRSRRDLEQWRRSA
jgi:ribosomal protein S10